MIPEQSHSELIDEIHELKSQLAHEIQLRQQLESDKAELIRYIRLGRKTKSGGCFFVFLIILTFAFIIGYYLLLLSR